MTWYLSWVSDNPVFSAAVQFAILGTFGELLSQVIRSKQFALRCTPLQFIGKILAWGLLGIVIKYGFAGMKGFVNALVENNLLPNACSSGLARAFAVSVFTNVLFGPQMMAFHRLEENLMMRRWNWHGLQTAWLTLLWFWIPAHTLTFSLPKDYQIGLAALWSVVLGIIMGLASPRTTERQS